MRSFRDLRENFRDIRIAYTFLITLSVVATILGILTVNFGERLKNSELTQLRNSLNLCSDSLEGWRNLGEGDEKHTVAARFLAGISTLPDDINLEGLTNLSARMKSGEATDEEVRVFSDTFTLLATLNYEDASDAEKIAAATLNEISGVVYPYLADNEQSEEKIFVMPEMEAYSQKIARRTIDNIFGRGMSGLRVENTEEGLVAETGNLRMSFSSVDGSLEEFVYIREGELIHGQPISESERVDKARSFFLSVVRHRKTAEATATGEICGFLVVDITAGDELWRMTVDRDGEVWSFFKAT